MRRFRLPRLISSTVLVLCCLLFALQAYRFGFKFGIETRFYRHPPQHHRSPPHRPDRPWYMRGGDIRPSEQQHADTSLELWPHESGSDRITNQLSYIPPGYSSEVLNTTRPRLKSILLWFGRRGWSDLPMGREVFQRDGCPVNTCEVTLDKGKDSELVLFKDRFALPKRTRPPEQIWMLFLLECPLHTQSFSGAAGLFNWTASYRHDSDVVAPYEKWVPYPNKGPQRLMPSRNYADGKTGKVAWFVSNCAARNRRLQYAKELRRHIAVDLFGKCGGGTHKCPRSSSHQCFQMLNRVYKFYLAFENSNCKDYITEKFFINGLRHDVIPIVMGARPEDYARAAPPHSYIHVEDFASPSDLASYLHLLDSNDTLYNSYFAWKHTGEFINTRFWCRLCALLHAPLVPKVYTDIETWWAGKGTCTSDEWRKDEKDQDVVPS